MPLSLSNARLGEFQLFFFESLETTRLALGISGFSDLFSRTHFHGSLIFGAGKHDRTLRAFHRSTNLQRDLRASSRCVLGAINAPRVQITCICVRVNRRREEDGIRGASRRCSRKQKRASKHAPSVIGKLRAAALSLVVARTERRERASVERTERRSRAAISRGRLLATTRSFARDAKLLLAFWWPGCVCVRVCVSRCSLLPYARVRARRCTYTEHGHAVNRVYDHSATVREEKVGACVPATFVHRGYMPRNFTTGLYRDTHTHGGTSLDARHSCGRGVFRHRDKIRYLFSVWMGV